MVFWEEKPGDCVTEKWRERETNSKCRAETRSSFGRAPDLSE